MPEIEHFPDQRSIVPFAGHWPLVGRPRNVSRIDLTAEITVGCVRHHRVKGGPVQIQKVTGLAVLLCNAFEQLQLCLRQAFQA